MSVTATFTGTLTVTDSASGTIQLVKTISGSYTGTEVSVGQSVIIGTSPVTVALPVSPTQLLYIKNLHATNTVQVTWTPTGGASNVVITLQPLATELFAETNATSGITALSLVANAVSTPVEFLLIG